MKYKIFVYDLVLSDECLTSFSLGLHLMLSFSWLEYDVIQLITFLDKCTSKKKDLQFESVLPEISSFNQTNFSCLYTTSFCQRLHPHVSRKLFLHYLIDVIIHKNLPLESLYCKKSHQNPLRNFKDLSIQTNKQTKIVTLFYTMQ